MPRRRAARVDGNHARIVAVLRDVGASVESLAAVADGVPDLLVGFRGVNVLMEVKDPAQDPNKRKLRPLQVKWHNDWRGQVCVVETEDEALHAIGAI